MANLLTKKAVISVGIETVPGDPVAGANLKIMDCNATVPVITPGKAPREETSSEYGLPSNPAVNSLLGSVEITMPIWAAQVIRSTSGAAPSPAYAAVLLRACGHAEGLANTQSIYKTDDETPTCTIVYRSGASQTILTACMGNCSLTLEDGDVNMVFTMQGHVVSTHTATNIAQPSKQTKGYQQLIPRGAITDAQAITEAGHLSSVPAVPLGDELYSWSLDWGNNVVVNKDIGAIGGWAVPAITSRSPVVTFSTNAAVLTGTQKDKYFGLLESQGLLRFTTTIMSPVTGVNMKIILNACSITAVETVNVGLIQANQVTASLVNVETTTERPIQIEFNTPVVS